MQEEERIIPEGNAKNIRNGMPKVKRERVEGYINQRKEMVNLQKNVEIKVKNKKVYEKDIFGDLFR